MSIKRLKKELLRTVVIAILWAWGITAVIFIAPASWKEPSRTTKSP